MLASTAELLPPGAPQGWEALLREIKREIGPGLFDLYFYGVKLEEISGNIAVVSTIKAKRAMLNANYREKLASMMGARWLQILKVDIVGRELGVPYKSPLHEGTDASPRPEPRMEKYTRRVVSPTPPPPSAREPEAAPEPEPAPEPELKPEPTKQERIFIEAIIDACCIYYHTARYVLVSKRRDRRVVGQRQMCCYLCKKLTSRSLPEIGRKMGDRDHTTVLHSIRKIEQMMKNDPEVVREIELLTRFLEYGDVTLIKPTAEEDSTPHAKVLAGGTSLQDRYNSRTRT